MPMRLRTTPQAGSSPEAKTGDSHCMADLVCTSVAINLGTAMAARVCHRLSQSMAAAMQRTPMKLTAVFSYRVAMARHSLSLAQRRST